jgi:hypothetical protein
MLQVDVESYAHIDSADAAAGLTRPAMMGPAVLACPPQPWMEAQRPQPWPFSHCPQPMLVAAHCYLAEKGAPGPGERS